MSAGNGLDTSQPNAPVPDEPPSNPERREYTRKVIAQLLANANAIEQMSRHSLLSPQKIDPIPAVLGSLAQVQRGLALILDDSMAAEGQTRSIRLLSQHKGMPS